VLTSTNIKLSLGSFRICKNSCTMDCTTMDDLFTESHFILHGNDHLEFGVDVKEDINDIT